MRPRVFPAEDARGLARTRIVLVASMRPRVFPAEDGAGGPKNMGITGLQ